jgi:dTDP-4-amino-4,6-dideoxygalactose transaminase
MTTPVPFTDLHEVIAPAHSWISTSKTTTQAGGPVVFCDTDPDTFTIDVAQIESKITPRTVGIIPVHLYGQPAVMDAIMAIAAKHKLWVIEGCAQAHLATYKGLTVGTIGHAGSFSFNPGKNLSAMGNAGAPITNDAALSERMTMFARQGGLTKGSHLIERVNSWLDGLAAAVLSVKLPHLPGRTRRRQEIATDYGRLLAGFPGLTRPTVAVDSTHTYHLDVVKHDRQDALAAHLKERGVQAVINYPVALPFLPAYERLGHRPAQFPNAHANQSRILSLPIFPEMTCAHLETAASAIVAFA